jgi:hypothetical protein
MAIVQISKIQQRSGNLVDLPQLDDAEFGWANDEKRLFIGKTNPTENIEVLTSYSNISFSQIDGASNANLNLSNTANGQILGIETSGPNVYIVNKGGNPASNTSPGGLVNLGNVSNVKLHGGAIGYVLETDGTGNLSWTTKGTILANIIALSNATPIVMTVPNTTPYVNSTEVTITGVNGTANANVNSEDFFVKLAVDYPTSGNVELYTDSALLTPSDGTGLTYTNSPNAIATTSLAGGGSGNVGGSNTAIQFNNNNILDGDADFTWDYTTNILNVNGTASIIDVNANGNVRANLLFSNVATGTAPITVTSTTRVANLNVSHANVSDFEAVTTQTTGTFYPVFVSANTSANYALGSNASFRYNAATGNLISTLLTGTLTTAAQPNITSVGSLSTLTVTGNANVGNLGTAGLIIATGNVSGGNINTGGVLSVTGNANVGNLGTAGLIIATGNVSGGNINTGGVLSATGNVTGGNLITGGVVTATGNVSGGNINTGGVVSATGNVSGGNINSAGTVTASRLVSNIANGTAPFTVTSTTQVANLNVATAGLATFATTANAVAGANVSGTVANATFATSAGSATTAGTVTTAAQPNITSVGTLSSLTVSANVSTGGIRTDNYYYANGVSISFAGTYSNSNVSSFLAAFGSNTITTTGNISAGNISASGNISAGNFVGTGVGSPTISSSGTLSISATSGVTLNNVLTLSTGGNTTAGNITGNWTLTSGSRLQSTYADLAEYYEADSNYEPGTVLAFGGDKEVTIAEDGTTRVAGVVSTNPAYAMNATCQGIAVAIALQGRVPTKVRGAVRKGDMMVSAGNGFARPWNNPAMGTVIGKALENFDGVEGIIEIAVGRL